MPRLPKSIGIWTSWMPRRTLPRRPRATASSRREASAPPQGGSPALAPAITIRCRISFTHMTCAVGSRKGQIVSLFVTCRSYHAAGRACYDLVWVCWSASMTRPPTVTASSPAVGVQAGPATPGLDRGHASHGRPSSDCGNYGSSTYRMLTRRCSTGLAPRHSPLASGRPRQAAADRALPGLGKAGWFEIAGPTIDRESR